MLVIRRRAGESLLIAGGIEVEILEIAHSQVKIGIRAPREVTILRREVHIAGEQNRIAAEAVEKLDAATLNLRKF